MTIFVSVLFLIAAGVTLRADLLRRRLSIGKTAGWRLLTALDVACVAATVGAAFGLIPLAIVNGGVPLDAPASWGIAAAGLLAGFLWSEGRHQLQFQRPAGIVFGEWLILAGGYQLIETAVFGGRPRVPHGAAALTAFVGGKAARGGGVGGIFLPFFKGHQRSTIF